MLKQHDLHLTWTPLLYKPGTDCHKSSHIWSFFMIFWHHKCKHTPLTSSTNEGIHKKKKCFKNDYRLHLSLTANSGHLAWLQQLWMGAALSSLTSFCWSCCRLSSGTQHQDHCVTYCKQYSLHSGQWQHFSFLLFWSWSWYGTLPHLTLGINMTGGECALHSSGAAWELRWASWAVHPNESLGFRGCKAMLNHAHALVSTCP